MGHSPQIKRPRYLYEQDHVACVDCRHFIPDSMGGGGIGDCRIGEGAKQKTCLYPHRERVCHGFSAIAQGNDVDIHACDDASSLVGHTTDDDLQGYEAWASSAPCVDDTDASCGLILDHKIAYDDTNPKEHSSEPLEAKGCSIDPALVGIAYVRKPVKKHDLPRF